MPWDKNSQVGKHTKKASSPKRKKQWRDIANSVLKRTGDDAEAIREANGVIKRESRTGPRRKR